MHRGVAKLSKTCFSFSRTRGHPTLSKAALSASKEVVQWGRLGRSCFPMSAGTLGLWPGGETVLRLPSYPSNQPTCTPCPIPSVSLRNWGTLARVARNLGGCGGRILSLRRHTPMSFPPSSSAFAPLPSVPATLPSPPFPMLPSCRSVMTQASLRDTNARIEPKVPSQSSIQFVPRRNFWSPRFLRQLGLPWFAQVFYGTLFVIGVGALAVTLFATSTVFAVLFLVAFLGYKLFNRQPNLMRQVMRRQRPAGSPPSLFGPLLDMMTDGMLFDGLKSARGAIERDVLGIINSHPQLRRYGTDFRSTGLHKMSMQVVNEGEKHVVMQLLVASSKPREMFVQVVASRHEEEEDGTGDGEERWDYEDVSVQTPDGKVIDLTKELFKGKGGRRIIIDVPPRRVKKDED